MASIITITVAPEEEFELPRWAEILKTQENEDGTFTITYLMIGPGGGPPRRPRR